ncbi:MAG: Ig-like domain-containing protein [Halarchaeum sp.]
MEDQRGVSEVVGAVLLFGILVVSISLYQVQVVPSENAQVEYQHNQQVQYQLLDVRNAILRTAATGNAQPTSLTLGTTYPARAFFINPPDATGALRTDAFDGNTNITLSNVTAASGPDGLDEYLDDTGHTLSFPTERLVYSPTYREYDSAPDTVYENGLLYNQFGAVNLTLTDQPIVTGNRITITALDGTYRRDGTGAITVAPDPESAPPQQVVVTNDTTGPLVLSIPTALTRDEWTNQTDLDETDGVTVGEKTDGRLRVELTDGPYRLSLSRIDLADGDAYASAHYLVRESDDDPRIASDETADLTVQVRDRFNNPVAGQSVNASVTDGPGIVDGPVTTGPDGRATLAYDPEGTNGTATVNVSFGSTPSLLTSATFTVSIGASEGSGGGGTGGGQTGTGGDPSTGGDLGDGFSFDSVQGTSDGRLSFTLHSPTGGGNTRFTRFAVQTYGDYSDADRIEYNNPNGRIVTLSGDANGNAYGVYQIGSSPMDFNQDPKMSSNKDAQVDFEWFRTSNGRLDLSGVSKHQSGSADMKITLYTDDGETLELYFDA